MRFAWLLEGPDRTMLDCWVAEAVRRTKSQVVARMMLSDKKVDNAAIVVSPDSAGSGSASSSRMAVVPYGGNVANQPGESPAKKQKVDATKANRRERMMALCCGSGGP